MRLPVLRLALPLFLALFLLPFAPGGALADPTPAPAAPAAEPVVLDVKADHPDGVYALGETVAWTVDVKSGDRSTLAALPYVVKRDAQDIDMVKGTVDLSSGPATITATRAEAGTLLLVFTLPGTPVPPATKYPAPGGVVFAPEKIGPAVPAPADFDAFWAEKLKELAAVPMNPVVEKGSLEGVKNADGVDYYKVSLDNIRGTKVRGQLARPTVGEKFPAALIVQYAGVYPLQKEWAVNYAKDGFLVLNIMAHDLPIDEKPEFYKAQLEGPLKNYTLIGNEDKDTSYFVRMFMGDVRAAEYLASRPDWNGQVLLVTGTSQGGLQSFVTAALYPKITALAVLVPAGGDTLAPLATPPRAVSWPNWLAPWCLKDKDEAKVKQTAGYFDPIYFAARAKCPALVAPGLLDETARPAGIFATFNALPNPAKELVILPNSSHKGEANAQAPYYPRVAAWKQAIKEGKPLPPPK